MTKYINLETKEKKNKKTIFEKYFYQRKGWIDSSLPPEDFDKVVYLGNCDVDGDMFACYRANVIQIYKGIKGDEF
jgi:hypothetical protein